MYTVREVVGLGWSVGWKVIWPWLNGWMEGDLPSAEARLCGTVDEHTWIVPKILSGTEVIDFRKVFLGQAYDKLRTAVF